jgi:hypothetical protein
LAASVFGAFCTYILCQEDSMAKLQPQAPLLVRIPQIWESAPTQAVQSVNTAHVCANWLTGQQIVQAEQGGQWRAGRGKALLKTLSVRCRACWSAPPGWPVSGGEFHQPTAWLGLAAPVRDSQMPPFGAEVVPTARRPPRTTAVVI